MTPAGQDHPEAEHAVAALAAAAAAAEGTAEMTAVLALEMQHP